MDHKLGIQLKMDHGCCFILLTMDKTQSTTRAAGVVVGGVADA